MIFKQRLCECVVQLTLQNSPHFEGCRLPPGGGGTPLYGLNGDVRPVRVWFQPFKQEKRTLEIMKIVQKDEFVPFLLALMPEACATAKLGKHFWLNLFRRGLKKS